MIQIYEYLATISPVLVTENEQIPVEVAFGSHAVQSFCEGTPKVFHVYDADADLQTDDWYDTPVASACVGRIIVSGDPERAFERIADAIRVRLRERGRAAPERALNIQWKAAGSSTSQTFSRTV